MVKNPPANAGDMRDVGLTPVLVRSARVKNGNPLQYSFLENPMERGARQATVHEVTMSQTQLSDYSFGASLVAQMVRNPFAVQETQV